MKNKEKKVITTKEDIILDILYAVDIMDNKRLKKEDFTKEHAFAVKKIQLANDFMYAGFMNISKARTLIIIRNKG